MLSDGKLMNQAESTVRLQILMALQAQLGNVLSKPMGVRFPAFAKPPELWAADATEIVVACHVISTIMLPLVS